MVSITGSCAGSVGAVNHFLYRGYYYDYELGFYYLNSRYYDPSVKRFINADGLITVGSNASICNMFSYCANNPINRSDLNGMLWEELKNAFEELFSAVTTSSYVKTDEVEHAPPFIDLFVSIKTGVKNIVSDIDIGSNSNPISVYANVREDNYLLSSVGATVNISDFSLNCNLGLDNTSLSGSIKHGDTTYSIGLKVDFTQLKIGIEWSATTTFNEHQKQKSYTNCSITAFGIASLYTLLSTGEWLQNTKPLHQGA